MVGIAAVGTQSLWTRQSPVRRVKSASLTQDHTGPHPSVRVDLSGATGRIIHPYLYGYASGSLLDHDFTLVSDQAVERSARTLAPPLLRLNTSPQPIVQSIFAGGVSQPDWAPLSNWAEHKGAFLRSGGRLVVSIGPNGGDTSIAPATWAAYAKAMALHFQETGQEVSYWIAGNECDPMGAVIYSRYFNAIADALHSVNPSYLVGGPAASWWNGIDLPAFIRHSGTRIGFIDLHSYPVRSTDSPSAAYRKAADFADVKKARRAISGTAASRRPIGLLEYNMNGERRPDGTFGISAQGTIRGAVYIALLLTRAFMSDRKFTMGALWDLAADSNYGVIGNAHSGGSYREIDEQGWYLREAAQIMPGEQVNATTSADNVQVLATRSRERFSIQLVHYAINRKQAVTVHIDGAAPGNRVERWELSSHHPTGQATMMTNLTQVLLPPESVVLLSGPMRPPAKT
jgi:hypothetical protein